MKLLVKRYYTHHDETDQCFLVMQRIGMDYSISVMISDHVTLYNIRNGSSLLYEVKPILSWCLTLGLLETLSILVGEELNPTIELNA